MFTIEKAKDLHVKFVAFYEAGKVAAALRHGVSILRYAMLKDGSRLVRGKIFTGFSGRIRRRQNDLAMGALPCGQQIVPWRIEDEVKRLGGVFTHGGLWRGYAVRDGNLITGQQ